VHVYVVENIAGAEIFDTDVIRKLSNPLVERDGLAVLTGNLAPDGAIVKQSAVSPHLLRHRGQAIVFSSTTDLAERIDDPVSGARLGLPIKQVPNKSQGKAGTRWASAQGQVQVETFRIREPGTTLALVYEQQKKEPSTRKLEVNLFKPELFILSGMQGLKKF